MASGVFQEKHVVWMQRCFMVGFIISVSVLYKLYQENRNTPNNWYLLLPQVCLLAHQCEEYVITSLIFGKKYHFRNWCYRHGITVSPDVVFKMNFIGPFIVNCIIYVFRNNSQISLTIALFSSSALAANTAFHYGITLITNEWSPGTLTGLLLFNSLQFYLAKTAIDLEYQSTTTVLIVLAGWIFHGVLVNKAVIDNSNSNHYSKRLDNGQVQEQ